MMIRINRIWCLLLLVCVGVGWRVARVRANGGETCATATAIASLPYTDSGTTQSAADDYDETCGTTSAARDVVYSYTPASNQNVSISLCTSNYDNFLYVYDTTCPGTVTACIDDACGTSGLRAELKAVTLTSGKTYYIVVDGYSTSRGTFTINVEADFLVKHPAGQENNAFKTSTSTTDDELFAFALDPGGGSVTVTQTVFTLSEIVGLVDGDWSGIELVVDSNDDGNISGGESTTVGGAGVIDTAAKTITFSTSFTVTAKTSYILRADFSTFSSGDAVTIDLLASNLSGSSGAGQVTTASHTLMDLANGLALYWRLNDNTGTSATDSSGNSRTGTLVNGPTWTGGLYASALNFDESNDHVTATDFSYGPDFTWTFWFKTEDNSGSSDQYILSHGTLGAQNSVNVYLQEGTPFLRTLVLDNDDTADSLALLVGESLIGTGWHFYTLRVEAGVGSKVYIDGVVINSDSRGGGSFNPTTSIYLAAREDLNSSRFYGGRVDDVRLYTRALSLAEIRQLAMGAGLKAHWKLDDGSGTTATDSSGLNNGTLTNSPTWTTGRLCGALDFDGANDYVDMGDVLDVGDSDDLTLTGWFNRDTFTTEDVILAKRTSSGTGATAGFVVFIQGTGDTLVFRADDGTDVFSMTSTTTFASTGWNHFAVVWDQNSASGSKIYINGVDDSATQSGTITNIGSLSNSSALRIGVLSDASATEPFDGKIDDIRIYNKTLSTQEIQALAATYTIAELGSSTGASSLGLSINDSEQVAGFDQAFNGRKSAWRAQDGLFTDLGTLSGGLVSASLDINASGTICGWSDKTGNVRRAFRWTSGGGMMDLGTLTNRTDSEALGINNTGEVVGTALNFGASPSLRLAFIYLPAPAYTLGLGMTSLGTFGGDISIATDINNSGQVVGGAENASDFLRPFRWANGTMTDLGTLGGESGNILHRAQAINTSGNVVGLSYTASGAAHAFYWNGSMTDLGVLTGGDTSWALDINDSNEVVGTANISGGAFHAFIWDSTNGMRDLNSLVSTNTSWTLIRATGINTDGEIAGWGTDELGNTQAFALIQTCSTAASAVQTTSSLVAEGSGMLDAGGVFGQTIFDDSGEPLARIDVTKADPSDLIEYTITEGSSQTSADADASAIPDLETGSIPGPGPGNGTYSGFVADQAFSRTLTVKRSSTSTEFLMTVRMYFTNDELDAIGVFASDVELHVLDPSRGMWVPVGKNIGQSPPTDAVGESGFDAFADGTVDFWAVHNADGIFAVGRPARTIDQDALPSDGDHPSAERVPTEEEETPEELVVSKDKAALDLDFVEQNEVTLDDELPVDDVRSEEEEVAVNQPARPAMPCGIGLVPMGLLGFVFWFAGHAGRRRRVGISVKPTSSIPTTSTPKAPHNAGPGALRAGTGG